MSINLSKFTSTEIKKCIFFSYINFHGETRFCWSDNQKQLILGAFFYGYIILQIPGGALSERLGPKLVLGMMLLISTVLAFITPLAAYRGPGLLTALRVLQGLCSGVTYPSLPPLIKRCMLGYYSCKAF